MTRRKIQTQHPKPPSRRRPAPTAQNSPRVRRRPAAPASRSPAAVDPSHVDPVAAERLAAALAGEERISPDALTHGFHSYAARMHPGLARGLIAAFSAPRGMVLDPFCGSGTVNLEAMVAGRRSTGIDLNPIGLRIAAVCCRRTDSAARERFLKYAQQAAEQSFEAVRQRRLIKARLPRTEIQWYEGHVLREMAGLWQAIQQTPAGADRDALEMVFSALVVKFSRQRADTAAEVQHKTLRKGLVTEFFGRKAQELACRWQDLEQALPAGAPPPRFLEADSLQLPRLVREPVDLILSSPPYGGTYDYIEHHARRYAWLGIDRRRMQRSEIGARRNMRPAGDGAQRWDRELGEALAAMAPVLAPGGRIVLVLGDGQCGRRPLPADEQVQRLAPAAGLSVRAIATRRRPDPFTRGQRREHLIVLTRAGAVP